MPTDRSVNESLSVRCLAERSKRPFSTSTAVTWTFTADPMGKCFSTSVKRERSSDASMKRILPRTFGDKLIQRQSSAMLLTNPNHEDPT